MVATTATSYLAKWIEERKISGYKECLDNFNKLNLDKNDIIAIAKQAAKKLSIKLDTMNVLELNNFIDHVLVEILKPAYSANMEISPDESKASKIAKLTAGLDSLKFEVKAGTKPTNLSGFFEKMGSVDPNSIWVDKKTPKEIVKHKSGPRIGFLIMGIIGIIVTAGLVGLAVFPGLVIPLLITLFASTAIEATALVAALPVICGVAAAAVGISSLAMSVKGFSERKDMNVTATASVIDKEEARIPEISIPVRKKKGPYPHSQGYSLSNILKEGPHIRENILEQGSKRTDTKAEHKNPIEGIVESGKQSATDHALDKGNNTQSH